MLTFNRNVYCILGLPFDAVDMVTAERFVIDSVARKIPCFLSTPNLNFVIGCRYDAGFRNSVLHSNLNLADGMPLVWLSRLLNIPIAERVAGSTLFERLRCGNGHPIRVFFFGGPDGAAEAASRNLNADDGRMSCVGWLSPGFGNIDDMSKPAILEKINASSADFGVVALGARKGQAWIERNRPHLNAPVISHLGAVVNFIAGSVRRAPAWMQNAGLEWLWRIREEPSLFKRYAADGVALMKILVTQVLPCSWYLYRLRTTPYPAPPDPIATETSNTFNIALAGSWTRHHLDPLRECFSAAVCSGKPVQLDLHAVTAVDSAFLGLLLLLAGASGREIPYLSCGPINPAVRKMFIYSGCGFLISNQHAHSAPSMINHKN